MAGSTRTHSVMTTAEKNADHLKHPWVQRLYKDQKKRKALSENYESTISGREDWWRTYIRETPLPGAYETQGFLLDLDKKQNTYRFKSDGRKIDAHPHGKGTVLLPGAYNSKDFLQSLERLPATYNFKGTARADRDAMNFGRKDKDINVSPNKYDLQNYLTVSVESKQPSKHSMFKSQSRRFPSKPFQPKIGPAPGNYEQQAKSPLHPISSSFKSKTPRFHSSHTRVPGPGSYEKTFQYPMSNTISNMGRQHGLFFTSAFQS